MIQKPRKMKAKKLFRFELIWLKDQRCEEIVKEAWEKGLIMAQEYVLNNYLEKCRSRLDTWNKLEFGHVGRKVAELQSWLEWLKQQPSSHEMIQALRSTWIDLNYWLEKEDSLWRQRSRLNWFQLGDRNTSFFHVKASARQKKNFIEGLMDANDVCKVDERCIEEVAVEYYTNLFTLSNPTDFTQLLQAV